MLPHLSCHFCAAHTVRSPIYWEMTKNKKKQKKYHHIGHLGSRQRLVPFNHLFRQHFGLPLSMLYAALPALMALSALSMLSTKPKWTNKWTNSRHCTMANTANNSIFIYVIFNLPDSFFSYRLCCVSLSSLNRVTFSMHK